jgi:hypothetical protein
MTKDPRRFYVYLFLRSKDSTHGKKYSPYYVGKGSDNRCYGKSGRPAKRPKDISYIVTVQEGLTEEEAFSLERYCIAMYGRLNIGTGILHNRTDGGEGRSGYVVSEETRRRMSHKGPANALWGRTGELSPRWGASHTEETKKKLSEAKKGERNPNWGKTLLQKLVAGSLKGKEGANSPKKQNKKSLLQRPSTYTS